MRLGIIYNAWDSEELLEGSIQQIKPFAAYVIAVWQNVSNYGDVSHSPEECIIRLRTKHLIDKEIFYKPNLLLRPGNNETRKRNIGLQAARNIGCTHFISMDCDEYYDPVQFGQAIRFIESRAIDTSACSHITYMKNPEWRVEPPEDYFVPFINILKLNTKLGWMRFPVDADPTRIPSYIGKFHLFPKDELVMHHYSWIRKDIRRKLMNTSARPNFDSQLDKILSEYNSMELGSPVPYYANRITIPAPNYFNIPCYGT